MHKILMVEDDPQLRELVKDYFEEKSRNEFFLDLAPTGNEGLKKAGEQAYDLILLDVMLPGADGFEICSAIRKTSRVPILFLTALGNEEDALKGYALGCDDYILKPFSLAQLYAKVNAQINRIREASTDTKLTAGPITLDPISMSVRVMGSPLDLPHKEYELLKLLMEGKGKIFSRDELIVKVWDYDAEVTDRVVDNHVKNLRKLLGPAGSLIKTTYKRGYSLLVSDQ